MISPTEPAGGLDSQATPSLVTHPRPKPHPIFGEGKGKKRKVADLSGDSHPHWQASGENKRNRNSQSSSISNSNLIAAPVEDIRQALIAQREPQPATISSLRMCSLTSIQHLTNSFSPHSVLSDPILVVSYQTIGYAYLSPMRFWGLDERSPASKWFYLLQYH